jgi:hypothetical protein
MRATTVRVVYYLLTGGALALMGACAHTYIDQAGDRHVVGWVNLTLPAIPPKDQGADWIRLRTIGFAYSSTDIGSAIELGYSDNTLAVIRKNSCVMLDPALAPLLTSTGESHAH